MSPLTRYFLFLCLLVCLLMDNALGVQVRVSNDLGNNVDLTVHCKSGDDDLGPHLIRPKGSYSFSFNTNFFGGTLFFCSFKWDKNIRHFDIYKQRRDYRKGDYFDYFVKQAGPCLASTTGPVYFLKRITHAPICYSWNA
ncbi:unnamed protein product [Vicia faba]|uniref:S-protein homolog n=1 Tax=Vicia faba TaxID=3906 RepID=A0AAV0Z5Z3_VICFA|nr:unnamed protein product [Vicia faba]